MGLWRFNDQSVFCDFNQKTGPKDKQKTEYPLLESNDEGVTWKVVPLKAPPRALRETAYLERGGKRPRHGGIGRRQDPGAPGVAGISSGRRLYRPLDRWRQDLGGKRIDLLPEDKWGVWPSLIRELHDGRLVLSAGCWRRGEKIVSGDGPMRKMMFISSDKGQTWSKPIPLMSPEQGMSEESDFCELPNGDLFWVHRSEFYPDHATDVPPRSVSHGGNPSAE